MKKQMNSVFGVYPNWDKAETAVTALQSAGFKNADISILVQSENVNKDALAPERHTRAPQGMALGAFSGAILGGGLGLAASLGSLMVPGIGEVLIAGPILSILTGMGMGGAAGSVAGTFVGVGFPENKSAILEDNLRNGNVLVSVHLDDSKSRDLALQVFRETKAEEITPSEENHISSVDDLHPTSLIHPSLANDDFLSRKQF